MFCSDPFPGNTKIIFSNFSQTLSAPHLGHDDTDVVDALYDRLTVPRDGDRPLRAVGQHLTGNLDTGPGHLNTCIKISANAEYFKGAPL